MTIYYSKTSEIATESSLGDLLKLLPEVLKGRALRYKNKKDAYNFVIGRLLLREGLKANFIDEKELGQVVKNEYGKPYIEGQNFHFNISHSNDLVACAVSLKNPLGIDVEQESEIDMKPFKTWFTVAEWASIYAAKNPTNRFFWYWRRKESILKAMGVPLSFLGNIDLRDGSLDIFHYLNKKWFLEELEIADYGKIALCILEKEKSRVVKVERF